MSAISFQREFVDDLLSGSKQHTTRPETDRFKVGDIVHVYIEQRNKIIDKPVRQMTGIGTTAMADRVNDINYLYPAACPVNKDSKYGDMPSYYAHFLGKVEIAEVYNIHPCEMSTVDLETWARLDNFKNFVAADKWFIMHYGGNWTNLTWTAVRWNDWKEIYFYSK